MNEQMGGNGYTTSDHGNVHIKTPGNTSSQPKSSGPASKDYIDFEEIK